MPSPATSRPTVYLHIGPPKTGTTFIQGTLTHWKSELRSVGIVMPGTGNYGHHAAAMDARGDHTAGFGPGSDVPREHAIGAWNRLLSEVHHAQGTVVISSELFATADADHARQVKQALADTDLHLVVTVRDPAKQLISGFQERVKQGQRREFANAAQRFVRKGGLQGGQDIPGLLQRWATGMPADHVHIVTVPPSGSDPKLLWERFASVVGIDTTRFGPAPRRSNESLGAAETEVLRRVNIALGDRLPHPFYAPTVKSLYARRMLGATSDTPRIGIDDELWPVLDDVADTWIKTLAEGGYDVRGDLDDLRPQRRSGTALDAVTDEQLADAAIRATADLLVWISEENKSEFRSRRQRPRAKALARRPREWLRNRTTRNAPAN